MRKLQFSGDVTVDQIFKDHKMEIYDSVLKSIKENYSLHEIDEINVVKITTGSKDYSINLTRDKFVSSLGRCIDFFESLEEYEKCQSCVDIISAIDERKKQVKLYGI